MMKAASITALILLSSCASKQAVHIFNHGYSNDEINAVTQALNESGFEARPNSLEIPEGIHASSIIYPSLVEDFSTVENIQQTLALAGHPTIRLIYETQGDHFYSTENVGLYLINPNYVEAVDEDADNERNNEASNLSHIYYSDCEEIEAELSLFPQSAAILELFDWNERTNRERSTLVDGQWSYTDSTITFDLFDTGTMLFEFNEVDGRDDYGRYYRIDLISIENTSQLDTCDFSFVTYDTRTTLSRN